MTASIAAVGVTKRFDGAAALDDVTLSVEAGEYAVLLGPSGCGKSTLLSVLGGFLTPEAGRVTLGGVDVTHVAAAKRPTTTMFQDYALFPHMTLGDNVAFGLRMRGVDRAARRARAADMLSLVGLPGEAARKPHELSGGQRQRVALARALAVEPEVLLLDEPLGALDLKLRRAMQDELKAIQRRVGTTFIHVTHDQEEAMAVADRIVVMNAGRIEDQGPPARVYMAPATLFAADFMGEVNLIEAEGRGDHAETPFGLLPVAAAGPVTLAIRPEHFVAGGAATLGRAEVADAAFFGAHLRARLRLNGVELTAHLPQTAAAAPGDALDLTVDPALIRVYPR